MSFSRFGALKDYQKYSDQFLNDRARLAGTKYKHIGNASREGVASYLDRDITERRIKTQNENFGGGVITMTMEKDKNGKFPPLNIGGRVHYPDETTGKIVIVDGSLLNEELRKEQERREYLAQVIDRLSVSNDVCSFALGVNCETLLGSGNDGDGVVKDRELITVDATPDAIENYSTDSITYSRAIQKFKQIIKAKMPVIQDLTSASIQHEGESVK